MKLTNAIAAITIAAEIALVVPIDGARAQTQSACGVSAGFACGSRTYADFCISPISATNGCAAWHYTTETLWQTWIYDE